MNSGTILDLVPDLTCTVSGVVITYALSQYNSETIPTWLTLDTSLGKLMGTLPQVSTNTSYNFYIDATSSEWTGVLKKLITMNLIASSPVSKETSEPSAEAKAASTSAQAGTAAVVGISSVGSLFSGSNPTVIWAILNQLQMLVLILLVDDFLPTDIQSYMQGVEFALFDFDFLPVVEIDFVDTSIDWIDFDQPNPTLEMLGFESRSTAINTISIFLVVLCIVAAHVTL